MSLLKILLTGLVVTTLTACSKTVQWDEEVLLNTGETIWVTKKVSHSIQGQPGNPADMGYLPDPVETILFKYGGQSYVYSGTAGIFVLAISPQRLPVLLASPGGKGWYRHNSYPQCAKPYYVQFVPDSTGLKWTWPDKIEVWTHNLPANLLVHRDHPTDVKSRYTIADKATQRYMRDPQLLSSQKINPLFVNQDCPKE